jgi:hypothetical protein
MFAIPLRKILKVPSQNFEGYSLNINLPGRPASESTKQWNGRTPTMHRVLEEKTGHDSRNKERTPVPYDPCN